MVRYYLYFGPWGEVYFHQFLNDDLDLFHDHPWSFVSILLSGSYEEHNLDTADVKVRQRLSFAYVPKKTRHRVVVADNMRGKTVSFVVTLGKRGKWFFYSDKTDVGTSSEDYSAKSTYCLPTLSDLSPTSGYFPKMEGGTNAPAIRGEAKC